MDKIIVTAGEAFYDIDALACTIAYKELLEKTGRPATALIPGPLNYSVGTMNEGLDYKTVCPEGENNFVVVDVSDPEKMAKAVKLERVVEIFDHHPGFEKFWSDRLGEKAHIETIGACATLIWEAFVRAGLDKKISLQSANLLSVAIVENSSNLNPTIATLRDLRALEELSSFTNLPPDWKEKYYLECEKRVLANLKNELINDTKIDKIPGQNQPLVIGQLELWETKNILENNRELFEQILKSMGSPHWMLNLLDTSGRKNYILTDDPATQKFFNNWLGVVFENNVAVTSELILRKRILKELLIKGFEN